MARDAKGRFPKGKSGNPKGRPRKEVERAYLDATYAAVTVNDWKAIVRKAVNDAKAGDPAARTWLRNLLVPKDAGDLFESLLRALE